MAKYSGLERRIDALEGAGGHSQLGEWLDALGGEPPAKPMHPGLKAALDALPEPDGDSNAGD